MAAAVAAAEAGGRKERVTLKGRQGQQQRQQWGKIREEVRKNLLAAAGAAAGGRMREKLMKNRYLAMPAAAARGKEVKMI